MKRLYECSLELETYVYAESEIDAQMVAFGNLREIAGEVDWAAWLCNETDSVPANWANSLPYSDGDAEQRTCQQILAAIAEEDRQREEWEAHPKLLEVEA